MNVDSRWLPDLHLFTQGCDLCAANALAEPVRVIVDAVKATLERTPPELAADVMDRGIVMTGGGSLLQGLDRLISEETGMPVIIAEDPLTSVVQGAGKTFDYLEILRKVDISPNYR